MQLPLRRPFSRRDAREPRASWPVTLFIMLASGFVMSELCTEWPAAQKWFLAAPDWLVHKLHLAGGAGWLEGLWTLMFVPAVVWTLLAIAARIGGQPGSVAEIWRRLALPLAVIVAAGHMSKGLAKFTTWAGFLPRALARPDGASTAGAISAKALAAPGALLPMWAVAATGFCLVALGFIIAAREARLAGSARLASVAPLGLLALLFGVIIAGWG
jgi:hypothetical protein